MEDLPTLIFNGKFEEAKAYFKSHQVDLNVISDKGNTPLLLAIDTGNLDMIEFLLEHNADPNLLVANINTPLIEAIEYAVEENDYIYHQEGEPRLDVIELLLKYGADMHLKDDSGRTPVSFAENYHLPAQQLFEKIAKEKKDQEFGNKEI